MDIPAAAGLIALGVVLAIGLLALAALGATLRRRPRAAPVAVDRPEEGPDDLGAFFEHPPGSPGATPLPDAGWVSLSAPPSSPSSPARAHAPTHRTSRGVLVALAVAAVVLAVAAAAVAAGLRGDGPRAGASAPASATSDPAGRPLDAGDVEDVEARLSFGGVVLERHAVGVTATYPELQLSGGRARLELPTYNCLADAAPPDPVAAGCRRTVPEHAELAAPDLRVTETGDGLEITGRFPTEIRPNGGEPVPTGRSYELVATVVAGERARDGWLPAEATLRLGEEEATTTDPDTAAGVNVLRPGGR